MWCTSLFAADSKLLRTFYDMEENLLYHGSNLPDNMVWEMFREGDDQAMNVILLRYFRPLLHYGSKFSADRSLVEDTIQDLFLGFLEKRPDLGNPASLKNYLFKCLRNNLIRQVKEKAKLLPIESDEALFPDQGNIQDLIMDTENLREMSSRLSRHFLSLTKRQKEVMFLRYYENRSNDEIAEIMDINKQSVSNLLAQSLIVLRENWVHVLTLLYFH